MPYSFIAVTTGMLTLAVLGGHMSEWTYIINGPCIVELSTCIDDAGDLPLLSSYRI